MKGFLDEWALKFLLNLVTQFFKERVDCDGVCGAYLTVFERLGNDSAFIQYTDYFLEDLTEGELRKNRTRTMPFDILTPQCGIITNKTRMRINSYHDYGMQNLLLETIGICKHDRSKHVASYKFPWPIQDSNGIVYWNPKHQLDERDRISFDGSRFVKTVDRSLMFAYGTVASEEAFYSMHFIRSNSTFLDQCAQKLYLTTPNEYLHVYHLEKMNSTEKPRLPLCFDSGSGFKYSQVFDLMEILHIRGQDETALNQIDKAYPNLEYTVAVRFQSRPNKTGTIKCEKKFREACEISVFGVQDVEVYMLATIGITFYIGAMITLIMIFMLLLEDMLFELRRIQHQRIERRKARELLELEQLEASTQEIGSPEPSQRSDRPSESDRGYSSKRRR